MPERHEEGMGPIEKGRDRYQKRNYIGALAAFSEAVNMSTDNLLLTALDFRAATYEKLVQYQSALRDAKQMIDLKPGMAKGYLRCAKVLQLKGERDLALKIYERGLNKVKIGTDAQRGTLQKMYNKLRDPGRSLDPIQFLPLELAEMVVQSLEMRDRVICLAVSKGWKRLLESSHKLWTVLDTTSAKRPVSKQSLRAHLRRSNYTLHTAIISTRARLDQSRMEYLTKHCKQLKVLSITGAGVIGDSLVAAVPLAQNLTTLNVSESMTISSTAVLSILCACHETLQEATFSCVQSTGRALATAQLPFFEPLKSLTLKALPKLGTASSYMRPFDLNHLLDSMPNIKVLCMRGWAYYNEELDFTAYRCLEHLELVDLTLSHVPLLPATITHLDLSYNYQLFQHVAPPGAQSELPLLESLSLNSVTIRTGTLDTLLAPSIKAGNLKSLACGNSGEDLEPIQYPSSRTLERLLLGGSSYEDDKMVQIFNKYPSLKHLDVNRTKITGVAVKHLVDMGIESLNLTECAHINPDAIEFARGRGVVVLHSFPSQRPSSFRDRVLNSGL